MFNIAENIRQDAEPRGIAVDTSDHVWVAVANNGDNGAVLEIDPNTKSVISTFGKNLLNLTLFTSILIQVILIFQSF